MLDIVKISRPGFWLTHLWFFLLPFSGMEVLGQPRFWLGCFYVTFPLGLLLYGWNDLGDAETDRLNPRKDSWLFGARPDIDMRRRLPWVIAVVQLPCLVAMVSVAGVRMLVWFLGVLLFNTAYNARLKSVPGLDLLTQAGYLLIFVFASWLCDVPQLNGPAMVFSALFAMQSHLFGQLMDVEQDRSAGRWTTAVAMGVTRGKWLLVALLLVETGLAWSQFSSPLVSIFMAAATLVFVVDAICGPRQYPLGFVRAFFVGWNIVVMVSMVFVWKWGLFTLAADRY